MEGPGAFISTVGVGSVGSIAVSSSGVLSGSPGSCGSNGSGVSGLSTSILLLCFSKFLPVSVYVNRFVHAY